MAHIERYPDTNQHRADRHWLRVAGPALTWTGFAIMWVFWLCFIVFLASPPWVEAHWPLPSVDFGGLDLHPATAAAIDAGLIALFGLQHSLMARPWFKKHVVGALPPAFERCLFVHAANIALFAMILLWQPLPTVLWDLPTPAREITWVVFAAGWLILLLGAMSFGIFDLLGINQMRAWYAGRAASQSRLKVGWLYAVWRHPMYVGVLTAIWATPRMTVGHFLMATGMTIYVVIAVRHEERDLARQFGTAYTSWREH